MICVGPFGRDMPAAAVPKPVDHCWKNVLIFLHLGNTAPPLPQEQPLVPGTVKRVASSKTKTRPSLY